MPRQGHDFVPSPCRRCRELLPSLPTSDDIERMLRRTVLWQKQSFGRQSEACCRFVERLLTVVQTWRLQGFPVLDYLHEALVPHRTGHPAPALFLT